MGEYRLTTYSKGSGCGCKLSPDDLRSILSGGDDFPVPPALLAGNAENDDAAVWKWDDATGIVATTDFFTPIVDDPYTFGKIAASNALSDVYAMGGQPFMALAILGWPVKQIPAEVAARVMDGAQLVCRVAGVTIAGGHSVETTEPLFGLSVTGKVEIPSLKRNSGARPGDKLILTKPLGNGIVAAAAKRGLAKQEDLEEAIRFMTKLNGAGAALGKYPQVHSMTDVTGFGLLGHLHEMMKASGTSAEIHYPSIPVYPFLQAYLSRFIYPDITTKNFSAYRESVSELSAEQLFTLCDPQTSGGLLISIDPGFEKECLLILRDFQIAENCLQTIGSVISESDKTIYVQ